jgi:4-hydroxybenzoyl-CoA reductase subunit beta
MLRMPPLEVHLPTTVAEAVALRRDLPASMYIAGGTDLLVNLKHRLHAPEHLVSLSAVEELVGIEASDDGTLRIGAGTVLQEVAESEVVRDGAPALAIAAGLVAGPQHRRMGTLGGNVMLDTRCLFYNQSESWREALGYCLKKDGDWCHVINTPKRCVAAHSGDTVPVLIALDAVLEVVHPEDGPGEVLLEDLYVMDGRFDDNHALDPRCLVVAIRIPPRTPGHRSTYRKVRARRAVDFPQLGLAVVGAFAGDGTCTELVAVVTAVLPRPQRLKRLEAAVGTHLEDEVVEELAEQTYRQVHPQTSIHGDPTKRSVNLFSRGRSAVAR